MLAGSERREASRREVRRMKTRAEERWERMQELLAREASGHDGPVRISSQRTLFGIKSHVEEVIECVAAEDEQRCLDGLRDDSPAIAPDPANDRNTEHDNDTNKATDRKDRR